MSEWIPTHGKRPDLPDGTLIEVRVIPGFANYGEPKPLETFDKGNWWNGPKGGWATHYRVLAGPVNAAQERPESVSLGTRVEASRTATRPTQVSDSPAAAPSFNAAPSEPLAKSTKVCAVVNGTDTPGKKGITLIGAAPSRGHRILSLTMAGWRPTRGFGSREGE